MSRQYKSYDKDFKKTVVSLYENGKGISELSREYGIGKSTIDGWIKKFKTITTSTGETTNNDEILKLKKELKLDLGQVFRHDFSNNFICRI